MSADVTYNSTYGKDIGIWYMHTLECCDVKKGLPKMNKYYFESKNPKLLRAARILTIFAPTVTRFSPNTTQNERIWRFHNT